VRALRSVSIERGRDARDLPLVAYGGAGPLHAARLADILGANRVVIPPLPGLFGALGLLQAGYRYDTARGVKVLVEEADPEWIDGVCGELAATLDSTMARDGVASSGSQTTYEADVRYRSGGAVIAVPLPSGRVSGLPSHLASTFRERHESAYGFAMEAPIEIVALRASAVAGESGLRLEDLARESHVANPDRVAYRHVFFGARDGGLETRVVASRLALDTAHAGPLIIEESDTTVLVPPGWQAMLDSNGNVLLTRARA
jgi:N-methylhydantoinase A